MSPHDFRRIILAYDLLVRDPSMPVAETERSPPDQEGAEPMQERVPAALVTRASGG